MAKELKIAVHQLVDDCKDEQSLQEVYAILEAANKGDDWWEILNPEQQKKTLLSIEQGNSGKIISHEVVSQKIWEKFIK
jgi:hypothetical protein